MVIFIWYYYRQIDGSSKPPLIVRFCCFNFSIYFSKSIQSVFSEPYLLLNIWEMCVGLKGGEDGWKETFQLLAGCFHIIFEKFFLPHKAAVEETPNFNNLLSWQSWGKLGNNLMKYMRLWKYQCNFYFRDNLEHLTQFIRQKKNLWMKNRVVF